MKTEWKGRSALHLGNDRVEMTMLTGGGHIVSFSFTPASGHATENVMWESPWTTADPLTPEHDELAKQYGGRPTGNFSLPILAIHCASIALDFRRNLKPASESRCMERPRCELDL